MEIKPIAHIETDFKEKFGIPRQSGRVSSIGKIVFEPDYKAAEAIRGIEEFSHLWLIFDFSKNHREGFSPTVRPPRLGGNKRVGVFASRSSFRPNSLGLSSVRLLEVLKTEKEGNVLIVSGADLLSGTPIYDIKPYIKYADSRPHALCGYVDNLQERKLKVVVPQEISSSVQDRTVLESLVQTLSLDPRPSYHDDPDREYGLSFAGMNVRFKVSSGVLTVTHLE
jgi:tRNA-Thr(GGU) m(6)t(6)A37 methyltransferase TsaA